MKYIKLRRGKKVHLVNENAPSMGWNDVAIAYCGKWAAGGIDEVIDHADAQLCENCKRSYLLRHTEEELFTELL